MLSRRQFLKAGLIGGIALSGLAAWYGLRRGLSKHGETDFTGSEAAMVSAVAAAVLAGMLPKEAGARRAALDRTVSGVARAIGGLGAAAQQEIGELFALLDFPPTRGALAGIWMRWEDAGPDKVAAFLTSWRHSRFALLQSAYAALHDLVLGAWYGQAESWQAIGYPGPPDVA